MMPVAMKALHIRNTAPMSSNPKPRATALQCHAFVSGVAPRLAFDAKSGVRKVTVKALPASALHLPRGQLLVLPHVKLDGGVGHLTSQAGRNTTHPGHRASWSGPWAEKLERPLLLLPAKANLREESTIPSPTPTAGHAAA